MKLELTEKEVRGIGERRWFRRFWKRIGIIILSPLLIAFIIGVSTSNLDSFSIIKWVCVLPLFLMSFIAYGIFYFKIDKVGKGFLRKNQ